MKRRLSISPRHPRSRKSKIVFSFISLLSLAVLAGLILSTSPNNFLLTPNLPVTYLSLGFVLLFILLFSITSIFLRLVHGLLVASFVTIYLLFRLFGLRHPFFALLLALLFIVFELFFSSSKQSEPTIHGM